MATVPMDVQKVARCRALAAEIADDVQRYIDAHTSVGVERTILRAYGAEGVDQQGAPMVNVAVDRYAKAGLLGRGIALYLGRALLAGAGSPQEAAERLAFGPELDRGEGEPSPQAASMALAPYTSAALARIDAARVEREKLKQRLSPGPT